MIYIVIFLILATLSLLDLIEDKGILKSVLFWCISASLIFISSIRWETGPDWNSYLSFYRDIELYTKGSLVSANFMEPGYTKMNLWMKSLGFNYSGFLCMIAILTIGLKARVISAHREVLMTALFLYYCYYLADIVSVRQFTALSITLFSSLFIIKRKPVYFFLFVVCACTIHITSVLFIFAYWIYNRRFSPLFLYSALLITLILGIINIADFAIDVLVKTIGENANLAIKLLKYQDQGIESTSNPYVSFIIGVTKRIIVLPLFIGAVKIIDDRYRERYIGYLNLLVFGNAIYFLFALTIPVIQRLSVPFLIFEIFIWAYLLISIKDVRLRFLFFFFILLFGAMRLYLFLAPYKDLYIPFQTIFDSHYIDRY
ncbi:MAG: EpsG family protein [Sphingobacteriaceae bacterium]